MMGCGQVVRHQVLVLAFGGSNPSIPAIEKPRLFVWVFLWLPCTQKFEPILSKITEA